MGTLSIWWEHHLGNYRAEVGQSLSLLERTLLAARALLFYASKLAWPTRLSFSYPHWQWNVRDPLQYGWLAACAVAAGLLWWKLKDLGRAPLAAVAFFVSALSPLLGFIPLYTFRFSYVANHYQYVACIGLIALFAGFVVTRAEVWRIGRSARYAAVSSLLLVLCVLTWSEAHAYRDPETLWRDTIEKNPSSWLAQYHLGKLLEARGAHAEAATYFRQALDSRPDYADAMVSLGTMAANEGRIDDALVAFRRATEIDPRHPFAHFNLGLALEQKGDREGAVAQYREALRILSGPGGIDGLLEEFLYPRSDFELLQQRAGSSLEALGQATAPRPEAGKATGAPADGLVHEGNAAAAQGRIDEAVSRYEQALTLDPRHALAHYNLALVFQSRGADDDAMRHYLAAIETTPSLAGAHYNLAVLLYRKGDYAGAWRELHVSRKYGLAPREKFVAALSEKLREPPE
jgi:tetratricopeptide (TPR) repeat protein